MGVKLSKFPQFYRNFTALLIFLCLMSIIVNIFHQQFFSIDEEKILRQSIIFDPGNSLLHEKLGQYYLTLNAQVAEQEYALAEEFSYSSRPITSDNVAGIHSSPWQTWLNIISRREKLKEEIKYWELVIKTYPDYFYANLKLAVLYYQIGEKSKSQKYLQTFLQEEPLNSIALSLKEKLK